MDSIMSLIAYPLGWIMWILYSFIPNYGLVILAFTLITKILLFPMALKQHKSVIARTRLQPQMEKIKNKYGKNPQKYQQELMALYQQEGINPASGCGASFIQLPIVFGMLGVVYAPLKYILRLSDDVINKALKITSDLLHLDIASKMNTRGEQYTIISTLKGNPDAFKSLGQDIIDKIQGLQFNFWGLDLSKSPAVPHSFSDLNWLILIPILSGITSLLVSVQSMKNTASTAVDDASAQAAQSMKFMMFMMPIISTWFAFKFPAGIGLYWIFSNIFVAIQSHILYKKYNPAKIVAKVREEMALRKEKEREERIEAKKRVASGEIQDESDIYKGMSQKEINKVKLANARKRDAEKYGDYND